MTAEARPTAFPFTPTSDAIPSEAFDESIFDRVAAKPEEPATEDEEPDDAEPPAQREGLPRGFRMRHDPHYVDELISGSRSRGLRAPLAAAEKPGNGGRAATAPHLSVAKRCAEFGRSLDAIGACLGLFAPAPRSAPEKAALELIGAEVFRATVLLRAMSLLDEDGAVANVPVHLASIVKRVVNGLEPGGTPLVALDTIPAARVRGDEELLTTALAALVLALQPVVERVNGGRVEIGGREEGDRVVIEVAQDVVRLPDAWRDRFLDTGWDERPGGPRVSIGLAAARRVTELHAGTLRLESSPHGGCRLTLSLPRC